MKVVFPLYVRLLGWFLLNVTLLALMFGFFFFGSFRLRPDWLLSGPGGERTAALTRAVYADLASRPESEWSSALARFSEAYDVKIVLAGRDGRVIAGGPAVFPSEVLRRLNRPAPGGRPGPPGHRPGPEGNHPPPPGDEPPVALIPAEGRYWLVIPPPGQPGPFLTPEGPLVLVIESTSLSAGGLIFDPQPWLWAGAGAIVFSFLFWLLPVRSITRALAGMTRATNEIARGNFAVRAEASRRDELGQVADSINHMAGQLAGYVSGQKRFMADIAHELCAPLARLRMALGILEERAVPGLSDVREEAEHLSALVDEMLAFSRASLGAGSARLQPVGAAEVAARAIHREMPGREDVLEAEGTEIRVLANSDLLLRALGNLLRNALRHGGPDCQIGLILRREADDVLFTVWDNGPGVNPQEIERLFDPFYRVDTSRTRDTGGAGLGLSIVKTCVEACGGEVSCRNREPGGFEVTIRLAGCGDL